MNSLLSLEMWGIFIIRILDAIFPFEWVLLAFLILYIITKNKKNAISKLFIPEKMPGFNIEFKSPALIFLILFIICDLGIRATVFFAGIPFSGRYFIPFTIIISIFAAGGIVPISNLIANKLPLKNKLSVHIIVILIMCIITLSYSGKVLLPHFNKPWLRSFGQIIKERTKQNEKAVILSNKLDERYGYYGNTEKFIQFQAGKTWTIHKKIKNKNAARWILCKQTEDLDIFLEKIKQITKKMQERDIKSTYKIKHFAIIRTYGKKKLDTKLVKLEKLAKMKMIKSFPYKKKRKIILFEYTIPKNTSNQ